MKWASELMLKEFPLKATFDEITKRIGSHLQILITARELLRHRVLFWTGSLNESSSWDLQPIIIRNQACIRNKVCERALSAVGSIVL